MSTHSFIEPHRTDIGDKTVSTVWCGVYYETIVFKRGTMDQTDPFLGGKRKTVVTAQACHDEVVDTLEKRLKGLQA